MDEEREDAALFRLLLPGPGSVVHEDRWNIFALYFEGCMVCILVTSCVMNILTVFIYINECFVSFCVISEHTRYFPMNVFCVQPCISPSPSGFRILCFSPHSLDFVSTIKLTSAQLQLPAPCILHLGLHFNTVIHHCVT